MYSAPYTVRFDNGKIVVYQHVVDVAYAILDYPGDVSVEDAYGYPIQIEDILSVIGF